MKICFKCGLNKPLSDYYAHSEMADGHLNKCKACTKKDTAARFAIKMKDPDWANAEAERHRIKQAAKRALGMEIKLTPEKRRLVHKKHASKYPEKHAARKAVRAAIVSGIIKRRPCERCGNEDSEAHHDDYSKPLDVIWLCPRHHADRHVEIRNEQRRRRAMEHANKLVV